MLAAIMLSGWKNNISTKMMVYQGLNLDGELGLFKFYCFYDYMMAVNKMIPTKIRITTVQKFQEI